MKGLEPRRIAVKAVDQVLRKRMPLDEALDADPGLGKLDRRDRAFTQALAILTLRHFGQILVTLDERLDRGIPTRAGAIEAILATGAAQILFMDVPDHAAVDAAVTLASLEEESGRYKGLVNAVLRGIARDRQLSVGPEANLPAWLGERWAATYGAETAAAMARAQTAHAPLDLTPKATPTKWAKELNATLLPTGTLRIPEAHGMVTDLPGFEEGAWWVQDASAQLAVLAMGAVKGLSVLDLCAAPGGKTMGLAARGAKVTAVERQPERMARLAQNLERVHLKAELVVRDIRDISFADPFDAILLDAPCTSTGTIRRHPDVAWTKREQDVASLAKVQADLLERATRWLKPGGRLVYATCSLEPEEGEAQIERFLARRTDLKLDPIGADEIGGLSELVTPIGTLRCRPDHLAQMGGLDGFFVARMTTA